MRLFVAVDLDAGARRDVAQVIARMRSDAADDPTRRIAWVSPGHLHLTLHFLGESSEEDAARLIERIAAPIDLPAFEIAFGGVGAFSSRGRPNVIWLGIVHGRTSLVDLHRIVGQRLTAAGCALEERAFSPHLTLARVRQLRGRIGRRAGAGVAIGTKASPEVARMLVDRVTLYESCLGRDGATHIALSTGRLRPGLASE